MFGVGALGGELKWWTDVRTFLHFQLVFQTGTLSFKAKVDEECYKYGFYSTPPLLHDEYLTRCFKQWFFAFSKNQYKHKCKIKLLEAQYLIVTGLAKCSIPLYVVPEYDFPLFLKSGCKQGHLFT